MLVAAAAVAGCGDCSAEKEEAPPPARFFATSAGAIAIDQDADGGNPFATALVAALSRAHVRVRALPDLLRAGTLAASAGRQVADVPDPAGVADLALAPAPADERRVALVIGVSRYSPVDRSLPGAEHDATRVARALEARGFDTSVVRSPDAAALHSLLAEFARRTEHADLAALYVTGHGTTVDGAAYLLPSDFPLARAAPPFGRRVVSVAELEGALRAWRANLFFYGACRDPWR